MALIVMLDDWAGDRENITVALGHFTTIHIGHTRYLTHAKRYGEKLLVLVSGDEDNNGSGYKFTQCERCEALTRMSMVDYVVPKDRSIIEALRIIRPKAVVLGEEFKDRVFDEETRSYLVNEGIEILYHSGDVNYASDELLGASTISLEAERRNAFIEACRRRGISIKDIIKAVEVTKAARIAVIGDIIVDQYAACEPLGISAEAPVLVVKELKHQSYLGGAGVVASHIRGFGAKCSLIGLVGDDSNGIWVKEKLNELKIDDQTVTVPSRPTTFKKRYIVDTQKIFRVSEIEDSPIDVATEDDIMRRIEIVADEVDAIVVSDFVYGLITERVRSAVQKIGEEKGIFIIGDLQCSSQVGSILRFKEYDMLCPNEKEVRWAFQDKHSGIEVLAQKLLTMGNCENLLLKLSGKGFITYARDEEGALDSQQFPALCPNPLDVTGAGDSILAVMATTYASGVNVMVGSAIAACVAALAVGKMGNSGVSNAEIINFLRQMERGVDRF